MKKIQRYKEGDEIPENSKYLYTKAVKENYKESNHTWCGCHDQVNCYCATWHTQKYFYYEIAEEKDE